MLKVFVVHGRDREVLQSLLTWLHRQSFATETLTFEELSVPGETVPSELERIAVQGDAALILATPDDLGRLKSYKRGRSRARQNVWLELGWFWARLGRKRTLLLVKGEIEELPSDISGILYLRYRHSLREISSKLRRFLDSLSVMEPESVTEVVHVATEPGRRSWEYTQVFDAAERRVVSTGIGMMNFRQQLSARLGRMVHSKPDLRLDLVLLDRSLIDAHTTLCSEAYRPNLKQDILVFEKALGDELKRQRALVDRVRLYRYAGIMTFSATVSDPPDLGSLMLVETILPPDGAGLVERPRVLLKRRCRNGLYDRFWRAITGMIERSTLAKDLDAS